MTTPLDTLRALYVTHGYAFFGPEFAYNLNVFGVRRKAGVNLFNDLLGCAYAPAPGAPMVVELWPGTTDPGSHYLLNPDNAANATAIVVPGQYRGVWALGLHRGADPAFVQVGPISVYRDGNRDLVLDCDPASVRTGLYGINGHHAGTDSARVDNWSAGCQVWKRRADHDRAMVLARAQVAAHPGWTKFTYTLFDVDTDPMAAELFAGLP